MLTTMLMEMITNTNWVRTLAFEGRCRSKQSETLSILFWSHLSVDNVSSLGVNQLPQISEQYSAYETLLFPKEGETQVRTEQHNLTKPNIS